MRKNTDSSLEMFQDQEAARLYLEGRRWPNGPICPFCGFGGRITPRKRGYYRCNQCDQDFTVRTNTVMQRSHIPLNKWLYVIYLIKILKKDMSSYQLAKHIGITQKSAWRMMRRLKEAGAISLES